MPRTIINNIVIEHYKEADFFEFCKYTNIRFFEILYFKKGSGTLKINGKSIAYTSNSLFVFIPDDVYIVDVESPTTVTTIKFLKSFFNTPSVSNPLLPKNNWFRKIELALNNEMHQLRTLEFQSDTDKKHLASLIEILCNENQKKQSYDIIIIENSLTIILHFIARNIQFLTTNHLTTHSNSKVQDIIDYIHLNIYESDLLNNKVLAAQFHIADNYIGQYFKKYMDTSLKKYILNYKLKLVENRLKYTDMSFSEIAIELGFTDASHLNKTFLAYKEITTGAFKAQLEK